jgi:hypothetical protein
VLDKLLNDAVTIANVTWNQMKCEDDYVLWNANK